MSEYVHMNILYTDCIYLNGHGQLISLQKRWQQHVGMEG